MRRPAAWPAWPAWLSRPTGARRATRRLRTQLLAAFALVTLVALAAAGSAVVWLMLDYRAQATTQRLHDAAAGATAAGFMLQRQGVSPEAIASGVAAQVPLPAAHVLVLDESGTVVAEAAASEGTTGATGAPSATAVPEVFTGRRLDVPSPADAPPSAPSMLWRTSAIEGMVMWLSPLGGAVVWRGTAPDGSGYLFVAAGDRPRPAEPLRPPTEAETESPPVQRLPGLLPRYRVVLAIPPHSLPSAWQELAPGLAVAVAVALLAAAGAAWWLAGSIARPIRAVTQAAERIAQGEPHRPIPEEGVEEVTQLARSFNTMGRAVERSQATLRDFVANASHELRTPLTAIQGFSQAVEDGVLPAPAPTRDAAAYIHREAERMRRLIEDLLLLSRVEARDRAATRQSVDVAELLDILAQRLRLVARDRNLHLELELPGQLLALGDATQLEHVFINLLDNAAKYAPDGATITVRAAYAPEPSVAVSVHNTGSYIAPDDLPHIFERFYRADRSRSREAGGSGLGLAIAREIVERHGGTIEVRSDAASGTTFSVTLPAAPLPAGAARATAAPRPRGAPASPPAVVARDQHSPVA